jgi:predicted RNase H-like nuclease
MEGNTVIPKSGLVLGIDVGYSDQRASTGIAVLEWDSATITLQCRAVTVPGILGALEDFVGGRQIACAALDGPLGGNLGTLTEHRSAEKMLTRNKPPECPIGKPGSMASEVGRKLHRAAKGVARLLLENYRLAKAAHLARIHDLALVEAFPTSFLGALLKGDEIPPARRRNRSDRFYRRLLGPDWQLPQTAGKRHWDTPLSTNRLRDLVLDLLPGRRLVACLEDVTDHDERAAVICAISALCVVDRRYMAVGDSVGGYIILPPPKKEGRVGAQDWAVQWLEENARAGEGCLLIEPPEVLK